MLRNNFFLLITNILFVFSAFSQISVTNTQTPAQLVQDVLLGSGVTVSNITINGSALNAQSINPQIGYFTSGASTFPIQEGVVISTGNIDDVPGNSANFISSQIESDFGNAVSDPDLVTIAQNSIHDALVLEFDFQAVGDSISFLYNFGSEEYPDFVTSINDVFGFFISGPGFSGPYAGNSQNIAVLPDGITPVSIDNVNNGNSNSGPCENCSYYINNSSNFYGNSVSFNGMTTVLTALGNLECGATYHIKIAIGDAGDGIYDSGVFLQAKSFSSNIVTFSSTSSHPGTFVDTLLSEECTTTEIQFVRPLSSIDAVNIFHFEITGSANNLDFAPFADSVIFNIGVDTVSINLIPINDGIIEPMEWIQINAYNVTECGDTLNDSIRIYLVDKYALSYDIPDTIITNCSNINPSIEVTNMDNSIPPFIFSWSNSTATNPTTFINTGINFDSTYLYGIITDGCGEIFSDSVLIINDYEASEFSISPNDTLFNFCPSSILTATAILDALPHGPYTYDWSTGSATASSNLSNGGINGSEIMYYVTTTNICGASTIDSVVVINNFVGPTTFLSPNDTIYTNCLLDSTLSVVMASGGTEPYSYLWSNGSTNNSSYIQVPNGFIGQAIPFFVTISDACGHDTTLNGVLEILDDYVLTYDLPATITTNCSDVNPVITATNLLNSVGPYTFSWSNSTATNPTTFINTGINFDSTYFHVIVTDGCGNIFPDSLLIVNNYEVSEFLMTPNDTLYNSCPLNVLSATVILDGIDHGPYSYDWSTGSTTASSNLTNSGADGSQITYTVTTTNICGMTTIDNVVVINDFLTPTAFLSPNDTLYTDCVFDSALCVINGASGTTPYTYLWSNGSTNDSTYIHDLIGYNNHSNPFQVTLTDACNNDVTLNGVLIVQKTLNATLTQEPATCIPDGDAYSTYVGETGTPTFEWIGPGHLNADTTYLQDNLNISSGWYYYTVTDDVCSDSDSIFVELIQGPIAKINATPLKSVAPATITFSNTSQNSTNYFWNFGNGSTTTSSDLSAQTSLYNESGMYTIEMIAFNGACSDTAFVTIELIDKPYIVKSPNVFSPNNDGDNDLFFITTLNVEKIELIITNRWGGIVFEETGPNPKWNGNGLNDGVYFYTYKATGFNGEVLDGQGFLHLVNQ